MAKLLSSQDKYLVWKIVGAMFVAAICVTGYMVYQVKSSPPEPKAPAAGSQSSLGTSSEAGIAYNRTFQERMVTQTNQAMDAMRKENQVQAEAARRQQEAAGQALRQDIQNQVDRMLQAMQAQSESNRAAPSQIESIATVSSMKPASKSGSEVSNFFGSPADVKPVVGELAELAGATEPKQSKAGLAVPPNGFVKARTLNGIVAVSGDAPVGFLAKLQGRYKAANGFVVNLDSCVAYIEGRADLAAGRVKGKPATLTCIFADGTEKTWPVSGYVVDKDGIEGIVGVINDNGNKKLLGAAAGGGIALAGARLSAAQNQTYTSGLGSQQALTGSPGADIAGGILQGAGSEIGRQVTEHYNQYKASVQVGGVRDITIVLLNELAVPDAGKDITVTRSSPNQKGSP